MSKTLVWFITGCSSGFGSRLVESALSRGDHVIATARSLDKLKTTLGKETERLRFLQLDVTSGFEQIKKVASEAVSIWGRIDVLMNNAGIGLLGITEESGSEMVKKQFEVNVYSVLDVTNAFLPYMRSQKEGTIVVMGSRSGWRSEKTPGIGAYASSKAAVEALTHNLAAEVVSFNIRVLLLTPGSFRTEGIYAYPFHTDNPITDYDAYREKALALHHSIAGHEKGDPKKAMEVVVDVVRGEGVAKGRPWPFTLILGQDAEADLRERWNKYAKTLEEWGDVTRSVWFDSEKSSL